MLKDRDVQVGISTTDVHRHAGIGLHTPASVHYGTAAEIRNQRAATLDAAYAANPARFRHQPPQDLVALTARNAAGVRLGRPTVLPRQVRQRIVTERAEGRPVRAIAGGLERRWFAHCPWWLGVERVDGGDVLAAAESGAT